MFVLKCFYRFKLVAFGKNFPTRNILQGLSSFHVKKYIGIGTIPGCFLLHCASSYVFLLEMPCLQLHFLLMILQETSLVLLLDKNVSMRFTFILSCVLSLPIKDHPVKLHLRRLLPWFYGLVVKMFCSTCK